MPRSDKRTCFMQDGKESAILQWAMPSADLLTSLLHQSLQQQSMNPDLRLKSLALHACALLAWHAPTRLQPGDCCPPGGGGGGRECGAVTDVAPGVLPREPEDAEAVLLAELAADDALLAALAELARAEERSPRAAAAAAADACHCHDTAHSCTRAPM